MSSILHEEKNGIDQINTDYCHRKMISFTHTDKTDWEAKKPIQTTIFLSPDEIKNNEINRI